MAFTKLNNIEKGYNGATMQNSHGTTSELAMRQPRKRTSFAAPLLMHQLNAECIRAKCAVKTLICALHTRPLSQKEFIQEMIQLNDCCRI